MPRDILYHMATQLPMVMTQSVDGKPYRKNVNLHIEPWLHNFIVTSAIINLALALFTIVF